MASIVATRYAQAFFELAIETNKLDVFKKEIKYVVEVLEDNQELIFLLKNPSIDKSESKEIIGKIFSGVDLYVSNFLMVLIDKKRFLYIDEIMQEFIILFNRHNHIEIAKVYSAKALSDDECVRIKEMLEKKLSSQIELELKIDEELLAGIRIHVAGEVLDNSIQNQFVKLKEQMTKNVVV